MTHRHLRRAALAVSLAMLAACGSAGATDQQPSGTIGGVGVLPDQADGSTVAPMSAAPDDSSGSPASTTSASPTSSTEPGSTRAPSIAERVSGNRLLMVGDSIFAATAQRYGGEACTTLVPLDWQVDVEAESGRAIDFGERVVRQMMPQGWDVVVFFLGTNYGGNEVGYREYLVKALDRIGPDVPVVLLTTTVYAEKQNEVNSIIWDEASRRPNITVLDWATISEQPGMLSGDGYHPSDTGRQVMVDAISLLVGQAPVAPGKCLQPKNRADVPNTPGAPTTTRPNSGGGGGTTTTTKPPTTAAATTAPATTVPPTRPADTTTPPATTAPAPATPAPTGAPATTTQQTPAPTTAPASAAPTTPEPPTTPTT